MLTSVFGTLFEDFKFRIKSNSSINYTMNTHILINKNLALLKSTPRILVNKTLNNILGNIRCSVLLDYSLLQMMRVG